MSSWIQNFQDLSNDVLGEIQEQVKVNRQRQYWKNAMDETIATMNSPEFQYACKIKKFHSL